MRNAKPQCFHVSGKSFTGNEKFQGNICLIPEETQVEDRWYCIMNNVVSPYDVYKNLSGFSLLVCKFSKVSIVFMCQQIDSNYTNLLWRT